MIYSNCMKRIIITLLFCVSVAFITRSQDKVLLQGRVFDTYMHEPIEYATIHVYHLPDSALLGNCVSDIWEGQPDGSVKNYTGDFYVWIPREGKCAVKISATGFETIWKTIDTDSLAKREIRMDLGAFYMRPPGRNLDEVVVTASKIKFYNKGDTIVYNADAFKLAEGSMLDALIEQLPGVELRDDGAIFVQGRYVESLLLNGKEFLGNNNQLLLSNLPSYTVKNVQVYDKLGRASELAGSDLGDSQYVMDVKLKKEYMVGMNLNAEAGIGSDNRYLGRLFAMGFTPNNQYMAYFNVNNLNDSRKPGQSGSWTPETMPTGVLRTIMGGFDYSIKPRNQKWEITGNANATRSREKDGTDRIQTNYLVDRNTYGYSFARELNIMLSLSTSHRAYWKQSKRTSLQINPNFTYRNWNRSDNNISATFNREYNNVTTSFIEGIYSGENDEILKSMLNRELSGSRSKGHSLNSGLSMAQRISFGGDVITFRLTGDYNNSRENRDNAYNLRFQNDPDQSSSRLQQFKNRPDFNLKEGGEVEYWYRINSSMATMLSYGYTHTYSKASSMLHYLEDQSKVEDFLLGHLPSATETFMFDPSNSFISRETSQLHRFNFEFNLSNTHWWLNFRLPMTLAHRELRYDRGDIHALVKRNRFLFNEAYPFLQWRNKRHHVTLNWKIKTIEPVMTTLVDYLDTTNPLYIVQGNPDLKNATQINTSITYSNENEDGGPGGNYSSATLSYGYLGSGISMVSNYDTTTGIRRSTYMNVNGNLDASVSGLIIRHLNRFDLNTRLALSHVTSVDLIGQNNSDFTRSKVFDNSVTYKLNCTYSYSPVKLGIDFLGSFNRFTSNLADFTSQNTWNFKTGINGVISLPANFQLSADLTMYNRRGYTDNALNTNNFVLNARLSKSILKGSLVFMLDGYDILHDLSNVSYTVNAQGRTETYRTVLPRYFMFHIQLRLSHTPKRRMRK